ncbi:hypothetical protein FJM67_05465 [Maribrevibacterium harenarium]|uniref:DUF3329 domain-containing protein n=1 Tax=Maribrevibacterium harenarium TaxID=2589817 RepID=A0A501WWG8_9GAMM|nr:hypothetical protein [Maribrevibacterium harenarium]TPE54063.1 hypothetical protein FJM67_05465 [Maribrevibacterium harenarium]
MLSEKDKEFFRPMWRRVLATALCGGWAILEWSSAQPLWAVLATGFTLYCLWNFFYKFDHDA